MQSSEAEEAGEEFHVVDKDGSGKSIRMGKFVEKLLRNNFLEKHSEQELFYTQQKIWKINLDYLDTVRP